MDQRIIRKKRSVKRSYSIFFRKCPMITNLLPAEATHTNFSLFEKQPLLITFYNFFTQKIVRLYSPDEPKLEFEILGDISNFIDVEKILLEVKCKTTQN